MTDKGHAADYVISTLSAEERAEVQRAELAKLSIAR